MLEGYVDESGQPRVSLVIVGRHEQLLQVNAIIDTGFDGALCLPVGLAQQAELQLWGTQLVELADGSQHEEWVYHGQAIFDGELQFP